MRGVAAFALGLACWVAAGDRAQALRDETASDLAGVVQDASHRPVGDAIVAVVPPSPGADEPTTRPLALARTRPDGSFRIAVPSSGPVRLSVTSSGGGGAFIADHERSRVPFLTLADGGVTVSGRVTWGGSGAPAQAQVRAHRYSDDQGAIFYAESSSDGVFALRLPPGTYLLMAVVAGAIPSHLEVEADRDRRADLELVAAGAAPNEVVAWLSSSMLRFSTVEPGSPPDDLARLGSLLREVELLAVGEATHGSREPIRLWHRLFEHLARTDGFSVLAFEGSFAGGQAADLYVQNAQGTARDALAHLRLFESVELLQVLEWLRSENRVRSGQLPWHVGGVDLNPPAPAARVALDALSRVDPASGHDLRKELAMLLDDRTQFDLVSLPADRRAAVRAAATALVAALEARDGRPPGDREDWALLTQYGRNVAWSVEMQLADDLEASVATRDRAMAENAVWLLRRHGPGTRMLLGAANEHVSYRDGRMGHFLRERLGGRYLSMGLVFDRGSFRAFEFAFGRAGAYRSFEVGSSPEGSLGETLKRTGASLGMVDLRRLPERGPVLEWFGRGRASWTIGAGFFPRFEGAFLKPVVAPAEYDALVFAERSTATTPLP